MIAETTRVISENADEPGQRPQTHQQKGHVEINGVPYAFVPQDPSHKPSDIHPWQHLKLVPLGHSKLTSSLMKALGLTDADLRAVLELETIQESVKRCPIVDLPKFMRGRTSAWQYTIEHKDSGDVVVSVLVGRYVPPRNLPGIRFPR